MCANPVVRSLELRNGLRLPYAEIGASTGLPVLLLHGYTDSWRSFEGVMAHLPPALRAIALSQRGHGDADRPANGYGPGDFAADLADVMEALALPPAVVVGHSMGAQVAQRFALDHPERVRGLVLLGAFATLRGNPAVQELWDEGVSTLADPVDPGFVRAFQESTLARPVSAAFLDMVVGESLKLPASLWRAVLAGQIAADATPELGRITAPTLILWGDRDSIAGQGDQETLAASIPKARLVVHAGAGHALHWEDPTRVAAEIAGFIAAIAGEEPPE